MTIRLVVTDVDGTLLSPDKQLTAMTRARAAELTERGIGLALASSRPPRGLLPYQRELGLATPIIAYNGGLLVDADGGSLSEHTLPEAVARTVLACLLDHGLDVWVYRGHDWFVTNARGVRVQREQEVVQFAPTVIERLEPVLGGAAKIVGVSLDPDALRAAQRSLSAALGQKVSAAQSHRCYLDVTEPAANKGSAIEELARRLGLSLSTVATIGDMPSDVEMFQKSGFSVAMGNASEDVRSSASWVTSSNADEGFARALEHIMALG